MKLSKSADFALRLVIALANTGKPETMPLLSKRLHVPYNNLSKLVQALAKAGILQTKQGKNGGIQLLKKPNEISLRAIIEIIDGPTRLSECINDEERCMLSCDCTLRSVLGVLQKKIDTLFEETKISQLVNKEMKKQSLKLTTTLSQFNQVLETQKL